MDLGGYFGAYNTRISGFSGFSGCVEFRLRGVLGVFGVSERGFSLFWIYACLSSYTVWWYKEFRISGLPVWVGYLELGEGVLVVRGLRGVFSLLNGLLQISVWGSE